MVHISFSPVRFLIYALFSQLFSPTFHLSAPYHKPLYNTRHPVVDAKKNGMVCLLSLSFIHPSSSFSLHSSIFICSSVCLFVAQFPWANPRPPTLRSFQYQAPGVDTQVSHALVTHTPPPSLSLWLFLPWSALFYSSLCGKHLSVSVFVVFNCWLPSFTTQWHTTTSLRPLQWKKVLSFKL